MNTHDPQSDSRFRTIDGALITDGLPVWDYDLRAGTVDFAASSWLPGSGSEFEQYWDGWFRVKRADGTGHSLMNGTRLWTVHPTTGEAAENVCAGRGSCPGGGGYPYGEATCPACGRTMLALTPTGLVPRHPR